MQILQTVYASVFPPLLPLPPLYPHSRAIPRCQLWGSYEYFFGITHYIINIMYVKIIAYQYSINFCSTLFYQLPKLGRMSVTLALF